MFGKARRRRAEKTRQRRVCAPVSQPICGRFGRGKNLRTAQKAVYQTVVYLLSFVQKSVRGKGQTDGAKKVEICEFLGADDIDIDIDSIFLTFSLAASSCTRAQTLLAAQETVRHGRRRAPRQHRDGACLEC